MMTVELQNYLQDNITYIDNENWLGLIYFAPEHLSTELITILLTTELVDDPELYKSLFMVDQLFLPEADLHIVLDEKLTLSAAALLHAKVRSITFDRVEVIGDFSLSDISSNRVVIPEGCTTLGNGAFQRARIGELCLPSTLQLNTHIGKDIFRGAWIDRITYNGTKLMFQTLCESAGKINSECVTRVSCKDGVLQLTERGFL